MGVKWIESSEKLSKRVFLKTLWIKTGESKESIDECRIKLTLKLAFILLQLECVFYDC
jgi:hypothetical protein